MSWELGVEVKQMKIRYSKKRFLFNSLLGGVFVVGSLLQLQRKTELSHYLIYGTQLLLGLVMVASYFYERKFQYLIIENGKLTRNRFLHKSLQLDRITKIQSFPGKIKIFTSEEKMSINTELIAEDSRNDLLKVLGSLNLENNPFIGYSAKTS